MTVMHVRKLLGNRLGNPVRNKRLDNGRTSQSKWEVKFRGSSPYLIVSATYTQADIYYKTYMYKVVWRGKEGNPVSKTFHTATDCMTFIQEGLK